MICVIFCFKYCLQKSLTGLHNKKEWAFKEKKKIQLLQWTATHVLEGNWLGNNIQTQQAEQDLLTYIYY